MASRQALARDYDVSEVKPTDSKYDTLQEADRVGTDTAAHGVHGDNSYYWLTLICTYNIFWT